MTTERRMPVSDQLLSFRIQPESIEPSLSKHIEEYLQHVDQLLEQEHYDWQNLMAPLAELDVKFHRFWSPILAMHSYSWLCPQNLCRKKIPESHRSFTTMLQ